MKTNLFFARHKRMYHAFAAPENRGNAVTIAVFGLLGVVALGGVIFAGAFHQLFSAGICYAMCRSAAADAAGRGNSKNV